MAKPKSNKGGKRPKGKAKKKAEPRQTAFTPDPKTRKKSAAEYVIDKPKYRQRVTDALNGAPGRRFRVGTVIGTAPGADLIEYLKAEFPTLGFDSVYDKQFRTSDIYGTLPTS
jgi:hypothetical protein